MTDRRAPAPGTTAALKSANQRRVVDVLRAGHPAGGALSQAEIARMAELAPATVSTIVRELTAAGALEVEAGRGRRGTTVRISRRAGLVAGVDFGHSHVAVALADLSGTLLSEHRIRLSHDHSAEHGLSAAFDLLTDQLTAQDATLGDLHQIGLGLPAPVSGDVVQSSAILPGWVGVDAQKCAEARFERPVRVDNDANLGALAEYRHGAGRRATALFFVKISSGLGAGIVLDGQVFRGATGMAGEIGHFTLDENGPFCRCGNRGCLEAYVSIPHILEGLAATLPETDFNGVVDAARNGHAGAIRMFEDVGLRLGQALALVTNLLNPDLIVIGGELARASELVLEPVRTAMRRHALSTVASALEISAASLGDRASLIGSVLLALEHTDLLTALAPRSGSATGSATDPTLDPQGD